MALHIHFTVCMLSWSKRSPWSLQSRTPEVNPRHNHSYLWHSLIVVALGKTDDRINLASLGTLHLATIEQAHFSMVTPKDISQLHEHNFKSCADGHRCVLCCDWASSIHIDLHSCMSVCCSPPWIFSITAMMCTSLWMAKWAATRRRSRWWSSRCTS